MFVSMRMKKNQDTSLAKQLYADDYADYDEYITDEYEYDGPAKLVSYLKPYLSNFSAVRRSNASTLRILDIGIGTGLLSQAIKNTFSHVSLVGVDLSREMLAECRKKKVADELHRCDIANEKLPFNRNAFDVAVSCGVFGFLDSLELAFSEMARVTATGGLVAFAYEENNEKDIIRIDDYVIHSHSSSYVRQQLQAAGIDIELKRNIHLYRYDDEPQQAGLVVGRVL
jgi:predicted TPR repeat methyltransferase